MKPETRGIYHQSKHALSLRLTHFKWCHAEGKCSLSSSLRGTFHSFASAWLVRECLQNACKLLASNLLASKEITRRCSTTHLNRTNNLQQTLANWSWNTYFSLTTGGYWGSHWPVPSNAFTTTASDHSPTSQRINIFPWQPPVAKWLPSWFLGLCHWGLTLGLEKSLFYLPRPKQKYYHCIEKV